jgi:S-formylglutathione hydrolase FrmB
LNHADAPPGGRAPPPTRRGPGSSAAAPARTATGLRCDERLWAAGEQHNPASLAEGLRETTLYVSYGNGDPGPLDPPGAGHDALEAMLGRQNERFVARLGELGIPATVDAYGPGSHTWPYWQRALHQSLPMLLEALGAKGP